MNIPVTSSARTAVAVLVLDRDEHVEHVPVVLVGGRVGDAAVHDLLHQRHQAFSGFVALAKALYRQVRIDVTQRVGAALQLVVEMREPGIELFAELRADEACRRSVDGELGEEVQQVDFALGSPVLDHPAHFALDGGGMTLHLLTPQRGVVQHLLSALRTGIEHHALPEDRRHEGVGLGLVEILVGGPEEEFVGVGA